MRAVAVVLALGAVLASATVFRDHHQQPSAFVKTALDEYIAKPDPNFAFEHIPNTSVSTPTFDVHYYNLTSLAWLNASEVDHPVWTHLVAVIIPVNCTSRAAPGTSCVAENPFLWITGPDNHIPHDVNDDEDIFVTSSVAVRTGIPGIVLKQVPAEPLKFACDPYHENRSPDAILGLSFWHFINDPSAPEWIVLLPMVKAAVKALDMAEAVLPQYTGANVTKFVVSGASKRGWTAWLLAAVEPSRVLATVPLVLDALGMHDFFHRQWQFYGGWTFPLHDWIKMNVTENIDTAAAAEMFSIMDPFFYLPRITMPKFAVNAGGDEFQMPDDQRHWGHDTVGEMHFLMVKNADHTLATGITEVLGAVSAFVGSVVRDVPRPEVAWSIDNVTGDITVTASEPPLSVDIAYGDSADTGLRDFRWAAVLPKDQCLVPFWGGCLRPLLWATTDVNLVAKNSTTWVATGTTPASGWRAFFIELRFANRAVPGGDDILVSSPASVLPMTRPFPDCHGEGCRGHIV